ncbi:unnamed protein product [Boreogadus saida]
MGQIAMAGGMAMKQPTGAPLTLRGLSHCCYSEKQLESRAGTVGAVLGEGTTANPPEQRGARKGRRKIARTIRGGKRSNYHSSSVVVGEIGRWRRAALVGQGHGPVRAYRVEGGRWCWVLEGWGRRELELFHHSTKDWAAWRASVREEV